MPSSSRRLLDALAHPSALVALFLLAVLTNLRPLSAGFQTDDYILMTSVAGERHFSARGGGLLDLFDWSSGDPEHVQRIMEAGVYPWWTHPRHKIRFARPLAALTHHLDHRLFPGSAFAAHLHSLAWFLVAVAGVHWLLRTRFDPGPARLGTLIFVLLPHHVQLVGWVAARASLMGLALGALFLAAHLRGRGLARDQPPDRACRLAAPALLVVALAANEGAAATIGFVLAAALALEEGPWRDRLKGVALPLGVVATWWLWYRSAGFGVDHSGTYLGVHPEDPGFWVTMVVRWLIYASTSLAVGTSPDLVYAGSPEWNHALHLFAGGCLLLGLGLSWSWLRRDRDLAFWVVSLLIAAWFCCLGHPGDRLLGLTMIGTPGLVVRWVQLASRDPDRETRGRALGLARTLGAAYLLARFALLHGVHRHLAWDYFATVTEDVRTQALAPDLLGPAPDPTDRTLVMVTVPWANFIESFPAARIMHGLAPPGRMRILMPAGARFRLTRTGPARLRIDTDEHWSYGPGPILRRPFDERFSPGSKVTLSDVEYTIEALTEKGSPARIEVRFQAPLEDPRFRWLAWDGARGEFAPFPLPAIGETVQLELAEFVEPSGGGGADQEGQGP